MTDGTVTQKTKYHCIAHPGSMQVDELRVFYGQLWCSDCWHIHSKVGKRWDQLDRFAAVPVAEQEPVAWARMKGGKVTDVFAEKGVAEFIAGFAVHKLVPLYLRPQPAEQPTISAYTCTVPDDCETLHWRGQILSMNELVSVAQPAVDEEIHVHIEGLDVLTLPLASSGMSAPRFVVHVPAQQPVEQRCEYCDGTGDVHSLDGEWRGMCDCMAGQQPAEQQPAPDEQYPPCDFCGVTPDHHPWHGSGMFKGFDSPHIHACNDCRHLLPAPDVAGLVEALEDIAQWVDRWTAPGHPVGTIAKKSLAAYRKQGGES